MNPTNEQVKAIEIFKAGSPMVIEAGAGTGKTTTLRMLAEACPSRRMQYLAFNRAIVEESKAKMPRNVECRTAHSLAFGTTGRRFAHRLRSKRMKGFEIARQLGIRELHVVGIDGKPRELAAGWLAGSVMRGIRNFCNGREDEPQENHIPYIEGIDPKAPDGSRTYKQNAQVKAHLYPALRKAWEDLKTTDGTLTFGHECYLKLYQLGRPKLNVDVVLFDEAQDANPVISAIVEEQAHLQRVYVGDTQQQIYEFTGAINAMQRLAGERTFLSQSFRFGPAIADAANVVLSRLESELKLTGFEQIKSSLGELQSYDAVLCRTNAQAIREMLGAMERKVRAHLVGGGSEISSFCEAAEALQAGRRTQHRDLACFATWAEVQDYVANDQNGDELALMVKLIDDYGCSTIIHILRNMPREENAELTVSTAHKAKGREWARVKIADDFREPKENADGTKSASPSELRLFYVAITRAREVLDVTQCPLAKFVELV